MLILTFVLLRCVLSRNNACLLELEVHHRQAHDVCMHLEGAETSEEWCGYDQEGYDNSEHAAGRRS